MIITTTKIKDLLIIENKKIVDSRGWFSELFRLNEFQSIAGDYKFVQCNESFSEHGVLRGIHYQSPLPQGKLVRVIQGEVFDVAVDLRKNSPTFGQWVGTTLSKENAKILWIPEFFGHGFYVSGKCAHIIYQCTNYYDPKSEHCIRFDDNDLNIKWPIIGNDVKTSEKDLKGSRFIDIEPL